MQESFHLLLQGDPRHMAAVPDESVHLALTAPPCWSPDACRTDAFCAGIDYDGFLSELEKVWKQVFRVLVPGGRLICVTGDIWLSQRKHRRHRVLPLTADICVACREIGYDNLNPIIWYRGPDGNGREKSATRFMGKPYEPNGMIGSDAAFILMQRKPGGYRKPTPEQRRESRIDKAKYHRWFRQFWRSPSGSSSDTVTPFPVEIAERLIRMFSYHGDIVFDPFCGTGTTLVAALRCNRSGLGIEPDEDNCRIALNRVHEASNPLFNTIRLDFSKLSDFSETRFEKYRHDGTP
jgi:modification methylase